MFSDSSESDHSGYRNREILRTTEYKKLGAQGAYSLTTPTSIVHGQPRRDSSASDGPAASVGRPSLSTHLGSIESGFQIEYFATCSNRPLLLRLLERVYRYRQNQNGYNRQDAA